MFSFKKEPEFNFPLGLRLNAPIKLSQINFALGEQSLLTKFPGEENIIKYIGVTENEEVHIYRFYFDQLDSRDLSYLEVSVNPKNRDEINHLRIYNIYDWITPETEEEFEDWMNEEDGMIGHPIFEITLDNSDESEDAFVYERVWGGSPDNQETPVEVIEKIHTLKKNDDEKEKIEYLGDINHNCMLYGRFDEHTDGNEYCFLSSFDGGPLETGIWIIVGIDIPESSLTVY